MCALNVHSGCRSMVFSPAGRHIKTGPIFSVHTGRPGVAAVQVGAVVIKVIMTIIATCHDRCHAVLSSYCYCLRPTHRHWVSVVKSTNY